MALYPCSVCRGRRPGTNSNVYPSFRIGDERYFARLRLCTEHLDRLLDQEKWGLLDVDELPDGPTELLCTACKEADPDDTGSLLVPVFQPGRGRRDLFATLCAGCGADFVKTYRLSRET